MTTLALAQPAGSPGALGYLLTFAVTAVLMPLPLALMALVGPDEPLLGRVGAALVVQVLGTFLSAAFAVPAAVVGCLLAHVALQRVSAQGWHVLAFALYGAAVGLVVELILFDGRWPWFVLQVGLATGLGRLCAVRLVPGRAA